jgi:GWxTD domain-containing protein
VKHRAFPLFLIAIEAALALTPACRLTGLERRLSPPFSELYDKVRYIMNREERKIFLELPDDDKAAFMEEFWMRRDPDPATEENEFKDEYFRRIDDANRMFLGEGRSGWLTDRGRIHILFGPPTDRLTDRGGDVYSRCQEVWYYGSFPVIFLDQTCTGNYKLVTYDLTGLGEWNLGYMHSLNQAQGEAQQTYPSGDKRMFDFNARVAVSAREPARFAAVVTLEMPYERIWFASAEGEAIATTFEVGLELRNGRSALVWTSQGTFEVRPPVTQLDRKSGKKHILSLPIEITEIDKLEQLAQGRAVLTVTLVNRTGRETLKKALVIIQ